jgi:hypothetical protein
MLIVLQVIGIMLIVEIQFVLHAPVLSLDVLNVLTDQHVQFVVQDSYTRTHVIIHVLQKGGTVLTMFVMLVTLLVYNVLQLVVINVQNVLPLQADIY